VRVPSPSAVHLPENDVQATERGDHVGDVLPVRHLRKRLEVREAGRSDLEPSRLIGAVGPDVDAELSLRALDGAIDLGVVIRTQRARHVRLDVALVFRPVFEQVDTLLDDLRRLLDLAHPNEQTAEVVAAVLGDDVPIEPS